MMGSGRRASLMLFSSLLLLAVQAPVPGPTPTDLFAMTRGGVQIEVAERPDRGALEVMTPYGLYRTAADPVQMVFERSRERGWLEKVKRDPRISLVESALHFRDNGQISALLELADAAWRRGHLEEIRAAFRGLEWWGVQLDPVPAELDGDARVHWLWEQAQLERSVKGLLYGGRLSKEVVPGAYGVGRRQLSLTEVRRGLRHENSLARRAAIWVAGVQLLDDLYLSADLMHLSLYGPPSLRDRAADSAAYVHPDGSREYWVRALLRAEDLTRLRAAQALVYAMPDYAPKAIGHVLSAVGKRAPKRYKYAGHGMQVVVDRREPTPSLRLQSELLDGNFLSGEHLENSSNIKVVKLSEGLQQSLLALLARLADDHQERTLEEWLAWAAAQRLTSR